MKQRLRALSLAILLVGAVGLPPVHAAKMRTTIAHYRVRITSVHWYERVLLPPLLFLLGRNWKTMSIATTFETDQSGEERVREVNAWPNDLKTTKPDPDEVAFRLVDGHTVEGFLWFLKRTQFRTVQVPQLLALYTYLYNNDDAQKTFDTTDLFEKKDGVYALHLLQAAFRERKQDHDRDLERVAPGQWEHRSGHGSASLP
ncbi:hypothetical protein KGO95_02550 [Patescibacteria group bacterium]|nr:hypothetical protein [Patescibacteria group bacterium]